MKQSFRNYNLTELVLEEVTMDELFTSVEIWFDTLSPELRKKHHNLGAIIQRIKKDESFDYSSMQSLLSSILEIQDAMESTS